MEYVKYSLQYFLLKIQYIFFVLFIICIPFQDFGMQGTFFNYFGKNLSNFPLIGLIVLEFIKTFYYKYKISKKFFAFYIVILMYIIVYSLIMILGYWNSIYFSLYIYKICSNLMIFIFWGFAYIYIKNHINNNVGKYVIVAYLIHILGWLLYDVLKINMGSILRYSTNLSLRYTGFTSEASFFSFTAILLGLLSVYYIKNNILRGIIILLTIFLIIEGGSKGTILCLFIASFIFVFMLKCFKLWGKIILLIIISIIAVSGINYLILDTFIGDLEDYTSFATRMTSILTSIMILLHYPLGTGFGAFLPIYKEYIYDAFDILNGVIPYITLSYQEISDWMQDSSGANMTIKSIFFQYTAYFGIPFIAIIFKYIIIKIKMLMKLKEYFLNFIFLFVLISLLTFANFNYDAILVFGILDGIIKKYNNGEKFN